MTQKKKAQKDEGIKQPKPTPTPKPIKPLVNDPQTDGDDSGSNPGGGRPNPKP